MLRLFLAAMPVPAPSSEYVCTSLLIALLASSTCYYREVPGNRIAWHSASPKNVARGEVAELERALPPRADVREEIFKLRREQDAGGRAVLHRRTRLAADVRIAAAPPPPHPPRSIKCDRGTMRGWGCMGAPGEEHLDDRR